MKTSIILRFILIATTFVLYSLSGIFSKIASSEDFLSSFYFYYICGAIIALGIYALLWQKILTFLPLHKAFLLKSITIAIILTVSHFFFREQITTNNILGASLIILGISLITWKD